MVKKFMGILMASALVVGGGFALEVEPASADGCGQECGTGFNQCIVV